MMLLLSNFAIVAFLTAVRSAHAASLPQDEQLQGTHDLTVERSKDITSKSLRAVLPATAAEGDRSSNSLISRAIPRVLPTLLRTSSESEITSTITGYFVVAQYSDTACLSVLNSESKKLNYCTNNPQDNTYIIYTASATEVSGTKYSDPACTSPLGTAVISKYSDACNFQVRIFVSDTGIPRSSTFMESLRLVVLFFLFISEYHIIVIFHSNLSSIYYRNCLKITDVTTSFLFQLLSR